MLEKIRDASDVKKLNNDELMCLADEIRLFLIENVSKTGGHLASNLGVVELTLALFAEFEPYSDRIIWDVGHQAYVHKILTKRADEFGTLRSYGGISGFPKGAENDADAFDSGHSSNSISAATGYAAAAKLLNKDIYSVAIIGDGAMTGGEAFEGMNHAGNSKLPVIVILNDNGMSISKNVGGLSRKLKRLRSTARYFRLKSNVKSTLDNVPLVGRRLKYLIQNMKKSVRRIVIPNILFEDFGFKYLGPVNGHDIKALRTVIKQAKELNEPVFIHINTKKGKGYYPAEKNPGKFHGIGPFDIKTGEPISNCGVCWSSVMGKKLCEVASENINVVAITAAMPESTGLTDFSRTYPNRFFDVGIAEQHSVTFAATLSKSGLVPVVAVYSTFLQRAYDQIIHDVSLSGLHVVFCIDRCGAVGKDGETHQGVFDIAYMTQVPYMTVFSPSNTADLEIMLDYAINKANGPVAIRYPRGEAVVAEGADKNPLKPVAIGSGKDVCIIAVGTCVYDACAAAKILEQNNLSATVVDMRCIKPMDEEFLKNVASKAKLVATVEDGVEIGGFGQQTECILENKVLKFAFPNEPIVQGSIDEIKRRYGLDAESIAEKIMKSI